MAAAQCSAFHCTDWIHGKTQPQGCISTTQPTPPPEIAPTQRRSNRTRADKYHKLINLEQSDSQGLKKIARYSKSDKKEKRKGSRMSKDLFS